MSNLPEQTHIVLNEQRQYQLTIDKAEFMKDKRSPKHSKGRPYMVINDRNADDKVVQDAIDNTGCNYA